MTAPNKALFVFAITLVFATYAGAQETTRPPESTRTEEHGEPALGWQIANFAILAGLLAYVIAKNAPPFFRARSADIQRALAEAAKAKKEAEERVAEMERRIAGLASEIERMRAGMRQEMAAEGERIRRETERHIHRIQQQAEQEIESIIKKARRELKMYSAELALRIAEEQLKGRITSDDENNLVSSFVADLRGRPGAGNIYN